MARINVDVEIDIEEHLDEVSSKKLLHHIASRRDEDVRRQAHGIEATFKAHDLGDPVRIRAAADRAYEELRRCSDPIPESVRELVREVSGRIL